MNPSDIIRQEAIESPPPNHEYEAYVERWPCPQCLGKGYEHGQREEPDGTVADDVETCPVCQGSGIDPAAPAYEGD